MNQLCLYNSWETCTIRLVGSKSCTFTSYTKPQSHKIHQNTISWLFKPKFVQNGFQSRPSPRSKRRFVLMSSIGWGAVTFWWWLWQLWSVELLCFEVWPAAMGFPTAFWMVVVSSTQRPAACTSWPAGNEDRHWNYMSTLYSALETSNWPQPKQQWHRRIFMIDSQGVILKLCRPVNQARGEAAVSQMVGQLRMCEGEPCIWFSECLALDKCGGMLQQSIHCHQLDLWFVKCSNESMYCMIVFHSLRTVPKIL